MASKNYPDKVKAEVLLHLKVNDGNQEATSRATGVPLSTVRRWRQIWDRDGVPPHLWDLTEREATSFTERAKLLRERAVVRLEEALDRDEVKPAQLIATVGVLTDKINLAEGFATSRQEVVAVVELPTAEKTAKFALDSMQVMQSRIAEIEAAESVDIVDVPPSAVKEI